MAVNQNLLLKILFNIDAKENRKSLQNKSFFSREIFCSVAKQEFLSNPLKKGRLIKFFGE